MIPYFAIFYERNDPMKRLVALLLVLVLTLPLGVSVSLAYDDDFTEDDLAALVFLAALDEAVDEHESNQSRSRKKSNKSNTPSVPASTAPVTAVNPYYANVQTNGGVLNVRNKANKGSTILCKVNNGTQLVVRGYTGNWLQVEVNGVVGFVPSRYVSGSVQTVMAPVAAAPVMAAPVVQQYPQAQGAYYAIVNPSSNFVNMRATPSTNAQVVGVYYYGYRLRVVANMGEWSQVYDESTGLSGYMASRFLMVDNTMGMAQNG